MDFFSSQHGRPPSTTTPSSSSDPFAQELGRRFSLPGSQPVLTTRLSPAILSSSTTTTTTTPSLATPQARLVSLSLRSKPSTPVPQQPLDTGVSIVEARTLSLALATPQILVLDIRPHATYSQSRIPHALSLSVPSTLLKRPAFALDKLADMLPSSSCRRRFLEWRSASRILIYDADSQQIPDGSNIRGLLRKFEKEGFQGDLSWLKGGFAAVWREQRSLVDNGPPSPDSSEEEERAGGYLRARKLPSSAFQQVSTTTAAQRPPTSESVIQHNPVAPAPTSTRPVAANPFYDNIRQNRELEHGITERIPLRFSSAIIARREDLPFDWLKDILDKADAEEGTEALAMQFYMIELREQRRLMGVMDHHSREARTVLDHQSSIVFPYSITAGVEKGSKNRYTNIWPFEHARVRLQACNSEDGSDYINASHVQPLGTRRRYIATQGPLPTTYTDFWTLCWEQNIQIIVMLTKQIEGSSEKCGCYWKPATYGPFTLELVSLSGSDEPDSQYSHNTNAGFDFGQSTKVTDADDAIVRRTFLLRNTRHPEQPPKRVTQLQYLAWPDYDVPEDPRGLLDLMHEINGLRAHIETEIEAGTQQQPAGPVLLHCSAGIGRTGGFIMIDAALDGIRREMRKCRAPIERDVDVFGTKETALADAILTSSPSSMDVELESRVASDSSSPRRLSAVSPRPRRISARRGQRGFNMIELSSGLHSEDSRMRSLSPVLSLPAATSSPSASAGLHPSAFAADAEMRISAPVPIRSQAGKSFLAQLTEGTVSGRADALTKFRSILSAESGGDTSSSTSSNTHLPSVFSASVPLTDKSTHATSSFPVSVESSRSPSPAKDTEQLQVPTTFDYTVPRRLHDNASPELLSSYTDPVRSMLEDMREQRMSLCQSLRQYVFVHRAIVEGALDLVDEENAAGKCPGTREDSPTHVKRGPSPTELPVKDKEGAVRLTKRPSFKRRERSATSMGGVTAP